MRAAGLFLAILLASGCREPPSGRGAPAAPEADDLAGDVELALEREWGEGRRVRIGIEREGGRISGRALSLWPRSSLMPEREFALDVDPSLLGRILSRLAGRPWPGGREGSIDAPACSIEVGAGKRTWAGRAACGAGEGELASAWKDLADLLHPAYFSARHLLEAGEDAESRLDAIDVFYYYRDGIDLLGLGYGPVPDDPTVGQVAAAVGDHEAGRYVEAVVGARNALTSRLILYERSRMSGITVTGDKADR